MSFIERVVNALVNIHPRHSLVVHFPTVFSVVGVLRALFALWRRNELFVKFAFFCMVITAAGTAAAGLAGLRNNLVHFAGSAPYLDVKIRLAVSLLLLSSAAGLGRWRNPDLLWSTSTRILYASALGALDN